MSEYMICGNCTPYYQEDTDYPPHFCGWCHVKKRMVAYYAMCSLTQNELEILQKSN